MLLFRSPIYIYVKNVNIIKVWEKNISSFFQLYEKTGKELCVVVTNLNHMTEEYCHVKTTPDMPIRLAVRMSMAIPGTCNWKMIPCICMNTREGGRALGGLHVVCQRADINLGQKLFVGCYNSICFRHTKMYLACV